ncbi:MAG: glycoside hydrolase family 127 protein [Clostridia bacterium]|nr:glycoside hydrolase family 127 protein [Clostridia bacterium]
MQNLNAAQVNVRGPFLRELMERAADKLIPYQWQALNDLIPDAEPSYCIRNMKAAAHITDTPHGGCVFQDSDLYKWIEAASLSLTWRKNAELEKQLDETAQLIAKAQMPDGYINTYYQLHDIKERFTNLRDNHELYCAGHLIEAACAHYEATGKRTLLDTACRFAALIDREFGREDGKKRGYPGHEEIELALIKLYSITHDEAHLRLAKYFIDERGAENQYFDEEARARGASGGWSRSIYSHNRYYQAGEPVRQQKHALGHAVRQLYLLSGMADVARETGDETLAAACKEMWKDITRRQMYITGQVGQSSFGEAFTYDYDLPNDTVYGETCASIALFFFAQRMLKLEAKGEYGDICDTLLYNGTISGMNLEGNRFFYVNPLENVPERSRKNQIFAHIKPERVKWFGCACCPPNLARMLAALPSSLYTYDKNTLYVNLFSGSDVNAELDGGQVKLIVSTDYPASGRVSIKVCEAFEGFTLALRLPRWVRTYTLTLNGKTTPTVMDEGYLYIERPKAGDEIVYDMDMPVRVVRAHPRVNSDAGLLAVMRGPVVYCAEEADNGDMLWNVSISPDTEFEAVKCAKMDIPLPALRAKALRTQEAPWDEYELYSDVHTPTYEEITAEFVPYYAWNNRGKGEMRVWLRESPLSAIR